MPKTQPVLVASPVGEVGYALLRAFAHAKTTSIPDVIRLIETETGETLKLATVYDQVKQYVTKGFLKPAGVKKSPETGRNVDLYRITDTGTAILTDKRAQMTALLALFSKVKQDA